MMLFELPMDHPKNFNLLVSLHRLKPTQLSLGGNIHSTTINNTALIITLTILTLLISSTSPSIKIGDINMGDITFIELYIRK